MERIKRPLDDTVHDYDNNKKQKLLVTTNKSHFESLANEIIYEIFEYLDVYNIYYGFYYLNSRFRNLIINSIFPFQVNFPTISKSDFELYHENVIKPNKYRIKILRLSNPFTVDIILSPPRTICHFIQLEKLIFDNVNSKYLINILKHLIHLPKFHSLILSSIDYIQNPTILFTHIFHLTKLKYCKIFYRTKDNEKIAPLNFNGPIQSSIEYLTIDSHFPYESLRKDHTFRWRSDYYNSSQSQKVDRKSVKHVSVCGKRATINSDIYFSNVTELTIKDYGRVYYGSMLTVLDPLMPLRQVNKLVVDCHNFPVKELVNLINVMPNLHILKWNYQSIDSTKSKLIQESETFKSVLCTNKIQHLEILHCCSLEEIRFFINLFPKLEYLKTGIYRREFVPITRCLFSTMHHLFFLCFTDVPKTYLKNLTAFIKLEHLLDEYFIKFIDHDLYLWW
ncbi:unnamed protein product [Rotaria magnacalcarata]|uniref:F-box domain-containing protein n=1 Tax=Rotaria magnacalcarata TaxID=392030 RepID=A0A816Z997_9BILA|nr:unnamed protein product [Rotaria magnacalcarata]